MSAPSIGYYVTHRAPRPRAEMEGQRCVCGHWPGKHRWGDNACPNPRWRCGNGQPQWLQSTYRMEAR